ncbi:MAG: ATP-binding protein [Elusimicrobiota bacterium]
MNRSRRSRFYEKLLPFTRILNSISSSVYGKIRSLMQRISNKMPVLRLRLRYKLIVLFIVMALPSLLFILFVFGLISNTLSSQVDSRQKAIVTSAHKLVEHYVLNCQKSLITLGSEKSFRETVSSADTQSLKVNLKRVFIKHKNFSFLGLVGKKNDKLYMLSAWPDPYEQLTQHEEIYKYLTYNFSHPKARVSKVYKFNGKREVFIIYPLRGALLIGGLNIENLAELLKKITPDPESSFILLDQETGFILGGEGKFEKGPEGKIGTLFFNKKKSIGNYEMIEAMNWNTFIMLSTPSSVIYRSTFYLRSLVVVFVILGVLTAVVLALYFSKRMVLPIAHLNSGARILGSGDLTHRINLETGDELEELADEFNSMAEKLKTSYDSMEEKIRIATGDLQAAYGEIEVKNTELQKADRLKSEFLASMSHELRTPMNAIIGFTSLLHDGVYGKTTKKQNSTYEKIIRNTRHLLNLVNDILDLSKIEAGRMELVPETVRVNLLLGDLKDEVKPLAEEKEIEFVIDSESEIECQHDYTRLRQVIMNLISNAIKFTKKGSVTVKTGIMRDKFFISVADTGIGIKEDELKHIFDEFVQADGSITREFGGSGLGLSICRKLTKMMNGTIEVESKWEEGSVFRIILPYDMKQGDCDENTYS